MPVNVTSPVNGDSLPSSVFYVSGTADPVPIYAVISQSGGQPVIGSLINFPPNFVFQFQNVPVGTGYTLMVQDYENPPASATVGNLTVVAG